MLQEIAYVILGAILLMVPGFLLSVVIYPKRGSLDFWKRMGLSLGLGVMLIVFEGYVIARADSFFTGTLFLATSVMTAILIVLVYLMKGIDLILSYVSGALGLARGLFVKLKRPKKEKPKEAKHEEKETVAVEKPTEPKPEHETPSKK